MPSNAAEFRRLVRKTVILPSGLQVEIRKFRMGNFVDLGDLPSPVWGSDPAKTDSAEEIQKRIDSAQVKVTAGTYAKYGNRAIVLSAVSPRFIEGGSEQDDPNLVHVDELSTADWDALVEACMIHSGIRPVGGDADAERFPERAERENSSSDGVDVSQAADRNS